MPDLTFKTVDVPESTRVRKENPFRGLVEAMIADKKAREFELPKKTDADEKALATAITQIQSAGRDAGVTVRKVVQTDSKTNKATVTVWVVDRIERKREREAQSNK